MIGQVGASLSQPGKTENENTLGRILLMMVEYINKILELLQQDYLCQCKSNSIK